MINQKSNIQWDRYTACAYAEGFDVGEEGTYEEVIEAFAYLISTGDAWFLQGWYGRTAKDFIEQGLITSKGQINWPNVLEKQLEE